MSFPTSINEVLELSPPALLGAVLYALGLIIKRSPIPNWLIPLIVISLGGLAYPFIAEIGKVSYNVRNPEAFNVLIGICIGSLSIGINELVGQIKDRFGKGEPPKPEPPQKPPEPPAPQP